MKKLITLLFVSVFILSAVSCTKDNATENVTDTIPYTLIISCDEILSNFENEDYAIKEEKRDIVPKDGIILKIEAKCSEDDNVYDEVIEKLKDEKLHFEGSDGYFNGIGNIYAGDCGQYSGWTFFVNGNLAENGSHDTFISENDIIEFKFIVDYNTLF